MEEAQDRHEESANQRRDDAVVWQEGDCVYVNMRNVKQGRRMAKLADKWSGPWSLTKAYKRAVALALLNCQDQIQLATRPRILT